MNKDEAKRLMLIDKILDSVPPNGDDLYHTNDFWSKYGGVSSGIYMCWHWYKIVRTLPLEELELINSKLK